MYRNQTMCSRIHVLNELKDYSACTTMPKLCVPFHVHYRQTIKKQLHLTMTKNVNAFFFCQQNAFINACKRFQK